MSSIIESLRLIRIYIFSQQILLSLIGINSVLLPSAANAPNGCMCPAAVACPSQPICPLPPKRPPCPCQLQSAGKTSTIARPNLIYIPTEEKLTLFSKEEKEIRRHPTKNEERENLNETRTSELLRVSSSSSNFTNEQDETVDGGQNELTKCNSQVLKKLMLDNINMESSNESKRSINAVAEHKFGGVIDVICSRGHFSYVYTSSLFCETSKGPMTCIAFRQASNN